MPYRSTKNPPDRRDNPGGGLLLVRGALVSGAARTFDIYHIYKDFFLEGPLADTDFLFAVFVYDSFGVGFFAFQGYLDLLSAFFIVPAG